VLEVVLAAESGSTLTAGFVLALKPPWSRYTASKEAAQTMAMLGIAKRLAAFLRRSLSPPFVEQSDNAKHAASAQVISTKEFAGAPVLGTKSFFGAELTW